MEVWEVFGRVYRANSKWKARSSGGGTGNPGGNGAYNSSGTTGISGNNASYKGLNGTGGLLIAYANSIQNNGIIEAKGTESTSTISPSGGASGGGSINLFYYSQYVNNGECSKEGGTGKNYGGTGGAGTISIGTVESKSFVPFTE